MCDTEALMPGNLSFPAMLFVFVGSFAPTAALASPATPALRHASKAHEAGPCAKPAVEVIAGAESATLSLSKCDGEPLASGVEQLSILARPGSAPKPSLSSKGHGDEIAPGIRRLDERLVDRLQRTIDHFAKAGEIPRITLVSGVRPAGSGSYHSSGRAIDFRVEGTSNEALMAFCKTLPDTGCGYYPNDVFVHMDVRDRGTGHVAWTDAHQTVAGEAAPAAPPPPAVAPAPAAPAPATIAAKVTATAGAPAAPAAVAPGAGASAPAAPAANPMALSLEVTTPAPVAAPKAVAAETKPAETPAKLPPLPASEHPATPAHRRARRRHHHVDRQSI
jgi:hypothetical protein